MTCCVLLMLLTPALPRCVCAVCHCPAFARLPLSDGRSWAMLRMYGPSAQAQAGGYQPPPIVKVSSNDKQAKTG